MWEEFGANRFKVKSGIIDLSLSSVARGRNGNGSGNSNTNTALMENFCLEGGTFFFLHTILFLLSAVHVVPFVQLESRENLIHFRPHFNIN